jgi:hypothetical protein
MSDESEINFWWRQEIFLFSIAFRLALGPTQSPIQWLPGSISPLVKQMECESNHSPPSSAGVKNAWTFSPLYVRLPCFWKENSGHTLRDEGWERGTEGNREGHFYMLKTDYNASL